MFCPNCGKDLPENAGFCPECGSKVTVKAEQVYEQPKTENSYSQSQNYSQQYEPQNDPFAYQNQQYGYPGDNYVNPDAGKVDFVTAIKLFFKNYANFDGRSTRTEYWWAYLFQFLLSAVTGFFQSGDSVNYVSLVVSVALFIPGLAIGVRRLHDTGKSWTYMLINLIPLVGWILYIIQLCKDSDGDNRWGPRAR